MKLTKEQLAQEYYKQYVEGVPLTQDEVIDAYIEGYTISEKKKNKQIKDKLNSLKSKLAEEKVKKLTKALNTEKIRELEIRIETTKELMNGK